MKLLLDENLSPRLVQRLAALSVTASYVAHLGRSGLSDVALWQYAFETDAVVATINVRDFMFLAGRSELHAGLIVLRRSGLSPEEQWEHLEPAVMFGLAEEHAGRGLINRVIEIVAVGEFRLLDVSANRP